MGVSLYTIAELRALEQAAQRDLPAGELMGRAAAAAAARIAAICAGKKVSVCILCGPGNNGGDGYMTADRLRSSGSDVTCIQLAAPSTADARSALAMWRTRGGDVQKTLPTGKTFDVVVDALLGIGQTRPLQTQMLAAVQWINAQKTRVISLDVPSGLHADYGCWVGAVDGVHATETITFIGDKPGLHTAAGTEAAGVVTLDTLGVEAPPTRTQLIDASDFPQITTRRRRNTHKGDYGSVAVVGGNTGMVGAALLAARAALRIGAGRVYVDCIGAPEFRVDPLQPELMFRPAASIEQVQCIVIGCGLGVDDTARRTLQWALDSDAPLVIDADALNLLARGPALSEGVTVRDPATVLTPHPLEAARLLERPVEDVQSDRVTAARDLASRYRSIVVLKGAGTVMAHTNGRCAINPTGSAALATAGTGDVLAGMLGGLITQGFDAWQATLAAVWLHGRSGEAHEDAGLVASELAPRAARVLAGLRR